MSLQLRSLCNSVAGNHIFTQPLARQARLLQFAVSLISGFILAAAFAGSGPPQSAATTSS